MAQNGWDQGSAGCQQSDRTTMCANNCGFFGSPTTLNMCSKCYTDHVAKSMQSAAATSSASSPRSLSPSPSPTSSSSPPRPSSPGNSSSQPISQILATGCAPSAPRVSSRVDSSAQPLDRQPAESREPTHQATSRPYVTSSSPAVSIAVQSSSAGKLAVGSTGSAAAAACKNEAVEDSPAAAAPAALVLKPTNRCAECRRRVGLTGFKCRCEGLFCAVHRYSDRHSCSFDYKSAGRQAIAQANPVVKADKVTRF